MNWPDNLEDIECVGFSESLLCVLIQAWDSHEVDIVPGAIRRTSTDLSWEFDYGKFRYRIDCEEGSEIRDDGRLWSITTPYRIERVGKTAVAGNGDRIVVEKYPITKPMIVQPKPPAYAGVWGSF
jgi:hypothetical protein